MRPQLGDIVAEVLEMLEPQMHLQGVCVATEVLSGEVDGLPPRSLKLTIYQLVAHALDSMPEGGDLLVAGHVDDETLELEVADSGVGAGSNQGLLTVDPLARVRQLAEQHGGTIRLVNCAQGGSARLLLLPKHFRRAAA